MTMITFSLINKNQRGTHLDHKDCCIPILLDEYSIISYDRFPFVVIEMRLEIKLYEGSRTLRLEVSFRLLLLFWSTVAVEEVYNDNEGCVTKTYDIDHKSTHV